MAQDNDDLDVEYERGFHFNPDPEWQEYIQRYEKLILQIALKACSSDEALREDAMQEARIALATVFPEQIDGYEDYLAGRLTEQQWNAKAKKYCGNVIRNSILSSLSSNSKGPWTVGRTRSIKDKKTNRSVKVHYPPRYTSLDELVDDYGMQVDAAGNITWPHLKDDGLLDHSTDAFYNDSEEDDG